jgi:hypothetical protein
MKIARATDDARERKQREVAPAPRRAVGCVELESLLLACVHHLADLSACRNFRAPKVYQL